MELAPAPWPLPHTTRPAAPCPCPCPPLALPLPLQEAARLMAAGEYELALPVALDAVQQGQALFKPAPALQLFPLYLLSAQVGEAGSRGAA